jgi:hypothetical protein
VARKALLIGAETDGLSGVGNDVKCMANALEQWGFSITRCEAENASRAGILDSYERLIADASAADAVFVYYSGHGGYFRPPDYETVVRPRVAMQYIVPADYHESTDGDFRGITSIELSLLLARLTERTKNVTMTLDCCHAAHMSRDPHVRPKALDHPAPYDRVAAHLESLHHRGQRIDRWTPLGNPDAVRIVACAPEQSAYEYNNEAGQRIGMLTEALALALAEASALRVTWSTVIERVRRRVLTLMPSQRPEAEGPACRLLFDVAEADPVAALPVVASGPDRVRLDGAPLLDVRVGDEFVIVPDGTTEPDEASTIGAVRIDRIDPLAASGPVQLSVAGAAVPLGARAHRTRAATTPLPVSVTDLGARSAELRQALAADPQLRLAEPDERSPVAVRVDPGGLTVHDGIGPLHEPRHPDREGVQRIVRDLKRLAQANLLRRLTEDPAHALDAPIAVEFGLVEAGAPRPLPSAGAVLYAGQRVYVKVRNDGEHTVYVSLLDIGVLAKITLLNTASPAGVRLDPGKEYVFGWNDLSGVFEGVPLSWPDGVRGRRPRPETILAFVSSAPQDLNVFAHEGIRRADPATRSSLEHLIDQVATGQLRDLTGEPRSAVRYTVRTIDFDLVPVSPPEPEAATFQVDDRPEPSALLWSPKGGVPTGVALSLSDVVVHHNRAFRSADIRLDAVVLTGGAGGQPTYRAQTERFHGIRDGERLPLDQMLIYHGPAVDYLDLAVWVSRDSTGSLALNDLLRERLTDGEIQGALTQLGGLFVAAPQAAVAVAALGASAIIINAAYHLLRGVVGDTIGLYRTTLLAHEGFGCRRQPGQNLIRAQDFSFSYRVQEVAPA